MTSLVALHSSAAAGAAGGPGGGAAGAPWQAGAMLQGQGSEGPGQFGVWGAAGQSSLPSDPWQQQQQYQQQQYQQFQPGMSFPPAGFNSSIGSTGAGPAGAGMGMAAMHGGPDGGAASGPGAVPGAAGGGGDLVLRFRSDNLYMTGAEMDAKARATKALQEALRAQIDEKRKQQVGWGW